MNKHLGTLLAFSLALFAIVRPSLGWSYKEHILFTRIAVLRLLDDPTTPPEMKAWLREAAGEVPDMAAQEQYYYTTRVGTKPEGFTGLSYWCYMPDEHALTDPREQKVAPFGVHERMLHFVDLELLIQGEARRGYRHDLSGKPALADIPRDMKDPRYIQAGMLPFRIEYCYAQLVGAIRERRLHAPDAVQQEGKTATYWAGYLAHYLADNTQPHHATLDYKSQTYFADKRNAPNIHNEIEWRMCDDEKEDFPSLRRDYWPMFVRYLSETAAWQEPKDTWQASMDASIRSYDALPLIGLAAMQAAGQAGTPEHPTGPTTKPFDTEAFFRFRGTYLNREMTVLEMKAMQTAWAVNRIARTYRQAWDEGRSD